MGWTRTGAAALAVAMAGAGVTARAAEPKTELYYFVTGAGAEDLDIDGPHTLTPAESKTQLAARLAAARAKDPAATVRLINTWGDYRCLVVIKAKGSRRYGERRSTNSEAAERDAKDTDITGATLVKGPICAN
ncbi:hypothetical protein [Caulobacter sp. 17J80-11]|uniref:hypothetical protein n=1 Tax=Caulobacter sp. 17J80-11 TaxID=2763502 RepID=UPI0016537AC7|nr:hypothetical protein [Caulobacter sp. 17J80-11]MBC6981317.1 hypothetical protein [Caulobacter sp. 17J80-11]